MLILVNGSGVTYGELSFISVAFLDYSPRRKKRADINSINVIYANVVMASEVLVG